MASGLHSSREQKILGQRNWVLTQSPKFLLHQKNPKGRRCELGFTMRKFASTQECEDIDECKEYKGICKGKGWGNLHCTNLVGSYVCACWEGYVTVGTDCNDIDECENPSICPENAICQNIAGNFTCQCNTGFEGDLCTDTDECSTENNCHEHATCSNTEGSYNCYCEVGFHGDGLTCKEGSCDDRSCPVNKECVSSTTKECRCKAGFLARGQLCKDIDECSMANDCDELSRCSNSVGSYTCICSPGYKRNGSLACVDYDECTSQINECDESSECLNTVGSYKCGNCKEGFYGNGKSCFPGNCPNSICPINQKCVSPRTLDCECKSGFLLNNSSTCEDVNECEQGICANCINTDGSFTCPCEVGYVWNGSSCSDLDECVADVHHCHANATCTNTEGSFTCSCNQGFDGDGTTCKTFHILVLQGHMAYSKIPKPAMIINSKGEQEEFKCIDTNQIPYLYQRCPITWRNQLYLYGSGEILRLDGYKLETKGHPGVGHGESSCSVMGKTIFLCFGSDTRLCHSSRSPLAAFTKIALSHYGHVQIQTSSSDSM